MEDKPGVAFELDRKVVDEGHQIDQARPVCKARLYFKDYVSEAGLISLAVRVDLTEHDRLHLPIQTRNIIHQHSGVADRVKPIRGVELAPALADS